MRGRHAVFFVLLKRLLAAPCLPSLPTVLVATMARSVRSLWRRLVLWLGWASPDQPSGVDGDVVQQWLRRRTLTNERRWQWMQLVVAMRVCSP